MIKFVEMNEGSKVTEETFNSFEELKSHLIEVDYFSWINDNEPEKELPNIEEFDYSWWTLTAEEI